MRLNPKVSLPNVGSNGAEYVFAYIENIDTKQQWHFLLNPEKIDISTGSNHEANPTAGVNVPRLQFQYGEAQTMSISGVFMYSPTNNTSLKPLLEALVNLTRSNPSNNVFKSPTVAFVWGSRRFSPAIVSKINFSETMWSNGECTRANGQIVLIETTPIVQNKVTTEGSSKTTERQKTTAIQQAKNWTQQNNAKLPSNIKTIVRSGNYSIGVSDNGNLELKNSSGKKLLDIGQLIQGKFKPNASSLF